MVKTRNRGFTLIEMLVVIVIVGIMVGLALPAVTNLMKSGGVSTASRHVDGTLSLARQYAITQRMYTRVVFPYSVTGSHPEMWYRTYAVMTNRDNTVVTGWAYLTKWEYLPVGVVFLDTTVAGFGLGALNDNNALLNQTGLPFPTPGTFGQLAYIEFAPTGVATPTTAGNGMSILAMTEGLINPGSSLPTPTTSKTISNTLANITSIRVDSLIGRVQVVRP